MLDVTLQLLCSKKSGTLSRVIREINIVGLQYRNHQIEISGDQVRLTINASGDPNCSLENLRELFTPFSEVSEVVELRASRDGKDITEIRTRVSSSRISATEQLTPAITLAAEKRLSDILGPVASVIVAAVGDSCTNAGQLYARLADELDDEDERAEFLSIID
ncbi:MAG TPA: hypothetical protein VKB27_03495 [Gammaproteobacteria bacterium]|nr:hypothetical protein [Gammaproteobacteria bacterium]